MLQSNAQVASGSVLIVEDDQAVSRAMQLALRARGYGLSTAASCAEGLAKAGEGSPSLLVLDINLPDGTGWELLASIRKARPGAAMRVLVVSSSYVSRSELRKRGADRFIPKPFDLAYFADVVDALLATTA